MAASSITRFFVDALASALELGIASPEDLLKHATPDVLARHLPRPIWSKLIAACLAAPRTDARVVVDTIGVPDLCAHVPATILWACLAEVGTRALGKSLLAMAPAPAPSAAAPAVTSVVAPSPVVPDRSDKLAVGTSPGTAAPSASIPPSGSQPVATHIPTRAQTEPPAPLGELPPVGSRAPTARPIGPAPRPGTPPVVSTTAPGNGPRASAAGASTRRPQAAATPTPTPEPAPAAAPATRDRKGPRTAPPSSRRGVTTNADFEIDTDVSEWKQTSKPDAVVVEDDLVDWAQAEETATGGVDLERKR